MTAAPRRPGVAARLHVVAFVDALGLGMYLGVSVLFLDEVVGLTPGWNGLTLGLVGTAALLAAPHLAMLATRVGVARAVRVLMTCRGAGLMALSLLSARPALIAALLIVGVVSRGTAPLIEALRVEGVDAAEAVQRLALLRTVRNIAFACSGIPVGIAVAAGDAYGYRILLAAAGTAHLIAALCMRSLPDATPSSAERPRLAGILRDRPFMQLTALYGGLSISAIVLGIGLPLWIVDRTSLPRVLIPVAQVVNTVIAILLQRVASLGTETLPGSLRHLGVGGVLAAAGTALTAAIRENDAIGLMLVIVIVVLLSAAELAVVAGAEGAALRHLRSGQAGPYLAVLNLGFGAATVVGPPLMGWMANADRAWWIGLGASFALLGATTRFIAPPTLMTDAALAARSEQEV